MSWLVSHLNSITFSQGFLLSFSFSAIMVRFEQQIIIYQHPFDAVSASLWSKYEGHKYVKEVDVLFRYIDDDGRLHSQRLLSIMGNIPAIFRPFVPLRPIYMLETVVVDPERQMMTVNTQNINMTELVIATSQSRYFQIVKLF